MFTNILYIGDRMNNGIQITYPRTMYSKLNKIIEEKINKIISEYMDYAKKTIQENIAYSLNISHDEYSNNDYLSIVFYISMYTGKNYPDNRIITITYNTKNNKIVTIQNLEEQYPNILQLLSTESRKILSKNEKITDSTNLIEGTKVTSINFQNFAFAPMGLLIFFPSNQIAPYSSGSFKILIPYHKLQIPNN